jgi:hypothetical protein
MCRGMEVRGMRILLAERGGREKEMEAVTDKMGFGHSDGVSGWTRGAFGWTILLEETGTKDYTNCILTYTQQSRHKRPILR